MKRQPAEDIPLVPFGALRSAVKKVLSNTKAESDRQITQLQAANLKRRAAKKKS